MYSNDAIKNLNTRINNIVGKEDESKVDPKVSLTEILQWWRCLVQGEAQHH